MRYLGNRNSKTAFTLAELLIVVAIIGVLVG
ncbi:MAG: prepilin-type N-terminal cleavage/methylation domain-containing protein, partial [Saccharofermentans sp.]|nr:prepilin-type N-terminal cleavage/methylation domain-containing protein [Saccharofermentans sp.]